ncbi:MAG: transposase [Candidatus Omnitrophota bacterium]
MKESTLVLEKDEVTATPGSAAKLIREVKYKTRKRVSSEDKIRIVLKGFRKEFPISDLCRRENISTAIYYSWLKDFMEAGKARLKGDGLHFWPSRLLTRKTSRSQM